MSIRTIDGAITPEMQAIYTQSTWLIQIVTPAQTIRASTRGEVSWSGETWYAIGAVISQTVSQDSMTFSMANETGAIFAMTANGELRRAPVNLYVMYPAASEAVHFMNGFVANATGLATNRATIRVDRYANEHNIVPATQIAPPGWTKLPPTGLKFEWAGKLIVLEQDRG